MEKQTQTSVWEQSAFAPILLLISVLSVGLLDLAFGIGLGAHTFLIAAIGCGVVLFFAQRRLFWLFCLAVGALLAFSLLCGLIFDWSYDGMYFHKQAIIALKEGWNPLYESSLDATVFASYPDMDLWLDNYPKGSWIFSAVIYAMTDRLETAKGVNILFLLPVFAMATDVMRNVFRMGRAKSVIFAFLFAANPVFICQLFTSYNDLPVGAFMILTALIAIKLVSGRPGRLTLVLLFCELAFACTVKFTAPVLCAAVLVPYGIYYFWKMRGEKRAWLRPAAAALAGFLFGGFVLGFNPYVKHIMEGKHVIYPVMGEGGYDIMNTNPPKGLEEKSTPQKLLISLFFKTDNTIENEPELKLPFRVYDSEWIHLSNADIRIGGFGVLFSGILLLSAAAFVLCALRRRRVDAPIALALVTLTVLALFFPESWWARYSCFTYYIPVFCAVYASAYSDKKALKGFCALICTAFFVNALFFAVAVLQTGVEVTGQLNEKLAEIQSHGKKVIVRVNDFPSHVKLFEEYGIDFEISHTALSDPIIFYRNTKYQFEK